MKFQMGVNQCRSRSAVSDEASGSGSTLLFFQINTILASDDFCRIANNLCKSFRSRSGHTFCLACFGSKLVVFPKAISDVLSLCILKCAIFTNYNSHMTSRDVSRRYISVHIQIRWLLMKPVDHGLHCLTTINSYKLFPANSHFCLMLITFANCLEPDMDPSNDVFHTLLPYH